MASEVLGFAHTGRLAGLQTPFNESHGQISPDGRWLTDYSNETGRNEVYVVPFPAGAGKCRSRSTAADFHGGAATDVSSSTWNRYPAAT
jgi:hypothetical protein